MHKIMPKIVWLCKILILLLFALPAFADNSATELTGLLQNVRTMRADFQQSIESKQQQIMQKSQGKMALKRPGLFRWETVSPNQQLIVADGNTIWIYDKDLEQVTKQQQKISQNSPGLLLSESVENLAKRYVIKNINTNDNAQYLAFKLMPKRQQDLFKSVQLFFNKSDHSLAAMILHDNLNQTTRIDFFNVKTNNNLPAGLFKLTPPQNVDVVNG